MKKGFKLAGFKQPVVEIQENGDTGCLMFVGF